MNLKSLAMIVAVSVTTTFALSSSAQETNALKISSTNRPPQNVAGRPNDGPVFALLTDEQRASAMTIFAGQQEKVRELQGKVRVARQELFSTALGGKFDDEAVRKQASTIAELESELTVLRLKTLSQIQPPLSSDQVEKIRNLGPAGLQQGFRPPESRPAPRKRVLQDVQRDENDLPPKQ